MRADKCGRQPSSTDLSEAISEADPTPSAERAVNASGMTRVHGVVPDTEVEIAARRRVVLAIIRVAAPADLAAERLARSSAACPHTFGLRNDRLCRKADQLVEPTSKTVSGPG